MIYAATGSNAAGNMTTRNRDKKVAARSGVSEMRICVGGRLEKAARGPETEYLQNTLTRAYRRPGSAS